MTDLRNDIKHAAMRASRIEPMMALRVESLHKSENAIPGLKLETWGTQIFS